MVTYKAILKIGEKLRGGSKKTVSTDELYKILREETGAHREKTLRHYLEILHGGDFITWVEQNVWEIGRNGDKDEK